MEEKIYALKQGEIHYWRDFLAESACTLVFLPGLTATHRLFEKQLEYFSGMYDVLCWDAPGHGKSRPFELNFTLMDKAKWLGEILDRENIARAVIIGQSMGGYVGQAFMEAFPGRLKGFISIDSAPLQRSYVSGTEIFLLKHTEWMYRLFPWKLLMKTGSAGCAVSEYGRKLMREMMEEFTGRQREYAALAGHGFGMLAEAMEADLPYKVDCPALLICGEEDHAGSAKRYNRAWHKISGIPIAWLPNAGHNSNTDQIAKVNELIEGFVEKNVL